MPGEWLHQNILLLDDCIDFSSLSILVVEEFDVLLGAGLRDQVISCSHENNSK